MSVAGQMFPCCRNTHFSDPLSGYAGFGPQAIVLFKNDKCSSFVEAYILDVRFGVSPITQTGNRFSVVENRKAESMLELSFLLIGQTSQLPSDC